MYKQMVKETDEINKAFKLLMDVIDNWYKKDFKKSQTASQN